MTVLEILQAPGRIRARIDAKELEIEMLTDLATSISGGGETVRIGGEAHLMDRVKSSHAIHDKMAEQVAILADASTERDELVADWGKAVRRADKLLEILPERQIRVMHLLYIGGLPIDQVAESVGVSRATAHKDRKTALATLEGVTVS